MKKLVPLMLAGILIISGNVLSMAGNSKPLWVDPETVALEERI